MTYAALVEHFSNIESLPIPIDEVINWVRNRTEHKRIKLHAVDREHKAFRGAFRRTVMPSLLPYNTDPEILNRIFYGGDLSEEWKRLVITKELLHVFDSDKETINSREAVMKLIPAIIFPEVKHFQDAAISNDRVGPLKAMNILLPETARQKLQIALESGTRHSSDIAHYCKLPQPWVEIWLKEGAKLSKILK